MKIGRRKGKETEKRRKEIIEAMVSLNITENTQD